MSGSKFARVIFFCLQSQAGQVHQRAKALFYEVRAKHPTATCGQLVPVHRRGCIRFRFGGLGTRWRLGEGGEGGGGGGGGVFEDWGRRLYRALPAAVSRIQQLVRPQYRNRAAPLSSIIHCSSHSGGRWIACTSRDRPHHILDLVLLGHFRRGISLVGSRVQDMVERSSFRRAVMSLLPRTLTHYGLR